MADILLPTLRTIEPTASIKKLLPVWSDSVDAAMKRIQKETPQNGMLGFPCVRNTILISAQRVGVHRDLNYGWTAVWTIRTNGHILHCQAKRGHPIVSVPLTLGSIVVFDSCTDIHWTTNSRRGYLVVLALDFKIEFGGTVRPGPSDRKVLKTLLNQIN